MKSILFASMHESGAGPSRHIAAPRDLGRFRGRSGQSCIDIKSQEGNRGLIGKPVGLAELSIFYCEEAFSFLEACGFEDERYPVALIRMYDQSVNSWIYR